MQHPYDYVGSFSRNDAVVDVVYVQVSSDADDKQFIVDSPELSIFSCTLDKLRPELNTFKAEGLSGLAGEVPAAATYRDTYGTYWLDIAFAVEKKDKIECTDTDLSISLLSDSYGSTYSDPTSIEMNSLDAFTQDLVMQHIRLHDN